MSKKLFVGGNWKCNPLLNESIALAKDVYNNLQFDTNKTEVVCAPVSLHIGSVLPLLTNGVQVAAQNSSLTGNGGFTGEHSAKQISDFGLKWVIIGHSERRALYGEDNQLVANKNKMALAEGLNVILCIGEKLEDRQNNSTNAILEAQLQPCLDALQKEDWNRIVVAYEPVWAIGTGVVATPEQAEETQAWVSEFLLGKLGEEVTKGLRIIYGGSVSDTNCNALIKLPHVDGFLVGGASLKPAFNAIVTAVNAHANS